MSVQSRFLQAFRWLAAQVRSDRIVHDAQGEVRYCWRRASVVDCCVSGCAGTNCELGDGVGCDSGAIRARDHDIQLKTRAMRNR